MCVCRYIFDIMLEGECCWEMWTCGGKKISLYTCIKFLNIMEKSKAKYNYTQI